MGMSKIRYGGAVLLAAALWLSACTPIITSNRVSKTDIVSDGLVYHLPRYLYRLTISPADKTGGPTVITTVAGGDGTPFNPPARPTAGADPTIPTVFTMLLPKVGECIPTVVELKGPIAIGDPKFTFRLHQAVN